MKSAIKEAFLNNGYEAVYDQSSLSLTKKNSSLGIILYLILFAFTVLLVSFGGYKMLLLLILMIGFPFLYQKWSLPNSIHISKQARKVTLRKNRFFQKTIPFESIKKFQVDEKVFFSDVSPFKEGHQDYVYVFKLLGKENQKVDLFSLKYRAPMDRTIFEIFDLLNLQFGLEKNG